MKHNIQIGTIIILIFIMVACDNREPLLPPVANRSIGFNVEGILTPQTKSSTSLDIGESFGVIAYKCPDGNFYPDQSYPDLLYNAYVEKFKQADTTYFGFLYNPTVHWPETGKVRFAAYYPHNSSLTPGTITVSPFTETGLPKFEVVLGLEKGPVHFSTADVGPIARLVSAADPAGTPFRTDNNVSFLFKRRMSYLQFRCKAVNMPPLTNLFINQIALRNVYRRGVFNMAANGALGAWEDLSIDATTGATLNVTSTTTPIRTDIFGDLVDPNGLGYRIAVFPQTYDNVEMVITYTLEYMKVEGGCEYRIIGTKYIPLSVDLQMGKLSIFDIELAFAELRGDKAYFNFKVFPWNTVPVNTVM